MADINKPISYNTTRMKAMGSRYTSATDDVERVRDVDSLYAKYKPLRLRIYGELSGQLRNEYDREELTSFINEHFIRLVKEYDPSMEVDFPGYIAIMLPMRARYSFLMSLQRGYSQEDATEGDEDILSYLEQLSKEQKPDDLEGMVLHIYAKLEDDSIDRDVLTGFIEGNSTSQIARELKQKYAINSVHEATDLVQQARRNIAEEIKKYLE